MARMPIGKTQRFRIFERDNFTCRYCGQSPPTVKLVIDHVIPVAEGGPSDDSNLVASCNSCNQGKGRKIISDSQPADIDRRLTQELLEQIDLAELAKEAKEARASLRDTAHSYIHENTAFGQTLLKATITSVVRLMEEFGPDQVFQWIDLADRGTWASDGKRSKESDFMRYLHGIARNTRESVLP